MLMKLTPDGTKDTGADRRGSEESIQVFLSNFVWIFLSLTKIVDSA
jgi:hypothetical protein